MSLSREEMAKATKKEYQREVYQYLLQGCGNMRCQDCIFYDKHNYDAYMCSTLDLIRTNINGVMEKFGK